MSVVIHVFPDRQTLASTVVKNSLRILNDSISEFNQAIWVLAGGTAPQAAYSLIADHYLDAVDWSRVTFIIGDERIAPLDSHDSNWHNIEHILLNRIPQATFLRPLSNETAESGAGEYQKKLALLPKTPDGFPRLDLVWLGMGEDGHTLSLFPDHPDFQPTNQLVIPVHDAPKPPADRLSLTLTALHGARHTMILTTGSAKADAVKVAQNPISSLPIAQAARLTHAEWYIDQAAAELIA